jgi:NitT/TauT family transport system permease protein
LLYTTPLVALVPLIITVFGIDFGAKVSVVCLFAVFPVLFNVIAGVQSVGRKFLIVAATFRAGRWRTLRTVIIPAALPYFFAGLRLAGGRALVGIFIAELVAGNAGIGYRMYLAGATFNTNLLMFLTFVLGVAGVLYGKVIERSMAAVVRWPPPDQG